MLEREPNRTTSVLRPMAVAFDQEGDSKNRCNALDVLSDTGVALDREAIQILLKDSDADVRTFALGLIQVSPDRDELMDIADRLAEDSTDPVFKDEAELLRRLLAPSNATVIHEV